MQKKYYVGQKRQKKDLANTLKLTKIHILKVGKRNRERSVIKEFLIRLQIRRSSHAATKDKNRATWTFWEKKRPNSCFDCFPRYCFIVSQLKAKCFSQFMSKLQRHFWKIFFLQRAGGRGKCQLQWLACFVKNLFFSFLCSLSCFFFLFFFLAPSGALIAIPTY